MPDIIPTVNRPMSSSWSYDLVRVPTIYMSIEVECYTLNRALA